MEHFTGLLPDVRTAEEKAKDYKAEEVASFAPVNWVAKQPSQFKKYEIFDQDGSSSCVAQATTKALGIENAQEEGDFIHLSARDIYTRRTNIGDGMNFIEACSIASKLGATLEELMPSQKKSEAEMNISTDRKVYKEQIGKIFKVGGYVQLPFDIEMIASTLQNGNPVLLGFSFDYNEWTDVPTIITNTPKLRHAVCGVDFTLWNGKKAIVIEDSWGKFGQFAGQRVITEDFLKARCIFAGYFLDLSNNWRDNESMPTKPKYTFIAPMKFDESSDNVKHLQEVLRYEQLFPVNVEITGYYGVQTAKGVLAFQKKYKVASDVELEQLQGRVCGSKTLAKLSELYG